MWRLPTSGHQYATQNSSNKTDLATTNYIAIETERYSRLFKKPAERICAIHKIEMAGGQIPFSKDMPCLPGKKIFITRLFGKWI